MTATACYGGFNEGLWRADFAQCWRPEKAFPKAAICLGEVGSRLGLLSDHARFTVRNALRTSTYPCEELESAEVVSFDTHSTPVRHRSTLRQPGLREEQAKRAHGAARAAKRARIASRPVKNVFARDNCGRRVYVGCDLAKYRTVLVTRS